MNSALKWSPTFFFHFSFRICLFRNQEVSSVNFTEIIQIGRWPWKNKGIFRWSILSKGNYYSCPVSVSPVKNPFSWICFSPLSSFQRHFAREGVPPKTESQFCLLQHGAVVWHISFPLCLMKCNSLKIHKTGFCCINGILLEAVETYRQD